MKRMNIKITRMQRSHVAAGSDIVAQSEPWKTLREGVDFASAIKNKQAFVALIGGAVAGFVIVSPEPVFARGGYLRALGVAPAIRGFGVGRQLMDFAERETAEKTQNLYLCVSSFNRPAQAFYREHGYKKVGKIDGLIRKGISEFIYWKKLR